MMNLYSKKEVVEFYEASSELQPSEQRIFSRYLKPNLRILDLGVGAGRTAPALSAHASRYVGIDLAPEMVEACRKGYPKLDFRVGDATDLSEFEDASFDLVVFSFNGIDCIPTLEGRRKCIRECSRVLSPDGQLIFSSHYSRRLIVWPILRGASPSRKIWRLMRSAIKSTQLMATRPFYSHFWKGIGYAYDPVHGGMSLYHTHPKKMLEEALPFQLRLIEIAPGLSPDTNWHLATPWYYYVFEKAS